MPPQVSCPWCGLPVSPPERAQGTVFPCPVCGGQIPLFTPPEEAGPPAPQPQPEATDPDEALTTVPDVVAVEEGEPVPAPPSEGRPRLGRSWRRVAIGFTLVKVAAVAALVGHPLQLLGVLIVTFGASLAAERSEGLTAGLLGGGCVGTGLAVLLLATAASLVGRGLMLGLPRESGARRQAVVGFALGCLGVSLALRGGLSLGAAVMAGAAGVNLRDELPVGFGCLLGAWAASLLGEVALFACLSRVGRFLGSAELTARSERGVTVLLGYAIVVLVLGGFGLAAAYETAATEIAVHRWSGEPFALVVDWSLSLLAVGPVPAELAIGRLLAAVVHGAVWLVIAVQCWKGVTAGEQAIAAGLARRGTSERKRPAESESHLLTARPKQ